MNDIVSHKVDSPELLSKLNFYVPSRRLRHRELFAINYHRTNYAKFGPMNQMMTTYNKHYNSIDLTWSKAKLKQYFRTLS